MTHVQSSMTARYDRYFPVPSSLSILITSPTLAFKATAEESLTSIFGSWVSSIPYLWRSFVFSASPSTFISGTKSCDKTSIVEVSSFFFFFKQDHLSAQKEFQR